MQNKYSFLIKPGITIVEDVYKRREPLPTMDCIYLVTPTSKAVNAIMADFDNLNRAMYRNVHIFFTEGKDKIPKIV